MERGERSGRGEERGRGDGDRGRGMRDGEKLVCCASFITFRVVIIKWIENKSSM